MVGMFGAAKDVSVKRDEKSHQSSSEAQCLHMPLTIFDLARLTNTLAKPSYRENTSTVIATSIRKRRCLEGYLCQYKTEHFMASNGLRFPSRSI